MQDARRKACGKTTTNIRVDAAVIHYLVYRPLLESIAVSLGGSQVEYHDEERSRRGGALVGSCESLYTQAEAR